MYTLLCAAPFLAMTLFRINVGAFPVYLHCPYILVPAATSLPVCAPAQSASCRLISFLLPPSLSNSLLTCLTQAATFLSYLPSSSFHTFLLPPLVQAATFLPLPLPGAAGPAAASQIKDPAALVRAIQTSAVSAVSAVWRHEKLPSAPPAIMSQ
eukprot:scaffold13200_cov21-Tisochrysis_lutea.AAC.1